MALTRKQKNIIKRWLAALRSGDYKQGTAALHKQGHGRSKDRFCCLGVLCDLAVKARVIPSASLAAGVYTYNNSDMHLPKYVQEWSGIRTPLGDTPDGPTLADMNDSGESFKKIARKIEQSLTDDSEFGLFV